MFFISFGDYFLVGLFANVTDSWLSNYFPFIPDGIRCTLLKPPLQLRVVTWHRSAQWDAKESPGGEASREAQGPGFKMAAQGNSWPWGRLLSTPQLHSCWSGLHLPGGFLYLWCRLVRTAPALLGSWSRGFLHECKGSSPEQVSVPCGSPGHPWINFCGQLTTDLNKDFVDTRTLPDAGENVQELDLSYISGGNVKWDNQSGKSWQFLKNSNPLRRQASYCTPGLCRRGTLTSSPTPECEYSSQLYGQWPQTGNNPRVLSLVNG